MHSKWKGSNHQRLYEPLGAPSLLYRHAPSYTNSSLPIPEPWGHSKKSVRQEARYIQKTLGAANRVRGRWYYSVDHPFRQHHYDFDTTGPAKKKKRRRKSTELNDDSDHDEEKGQEVKHIKPDQFRNKSDPHSLFHLMNAARQAIAPDDTSLRMRHLYDQAYIPAQKRSSNAAPRLPKKGLAMSRVMAKERMDSELSYLAPMGIGTIRHALVAENEGVALHRQTLKMEATTDDHPSCYGNCLVCVSCPCSECKSETSETIDDDEDDDDMTGSDTLKDGTKQKSTGWCLIHPTGELLSRVSASNLILPSGVANKETGSRNDRQQRKQESRHELEVGEPIRQVLQCGRWGVQATFDDVDNNNNNNEAMGMFVARSPNYCTVFSIRTQSNERVSTTPLQQRCSGKYSLEEVTRIDLRSLYRSQPSYRPMHVTCHPNYGNAFTDPKFAILSHCQMRKETNVIHHVMMDDPFLVQQHAIPCLKSIAEIDFTNSHPMTLWASARSYVRPALTRRFQRDRPMLGHGNALYTIDLRSNDAIFQWSPSAEELLPEGIHSVTGVRTDWQREHAVWVTSKSALKTWEIDGRMPCRAVNSWSLANACDDWGAVVPATVGLHGAGTLFTQPASADTNGATPCPMLSVDKSPGSFGIHLYQRPDHLPRFHTNSLESVAGPGFSSGVAGQEASVCTNSIFALPDVSGTTFTCGIAAIRTPVADVLEDASRLGYERDPTDALCVFTMTNKGDMYAHTLLECHPDTTRMTRSFDDLPLGYAAVSVPKTEFKQESGCSTARSSGGSYIQLRLSNTFPLSSNAIVPDKTMTRKDCRPFKTIRMEDLPMLDHDNGRDTSGKANDTESQIPEAASVQHAICDSGLGAVMTNSSPDRSGKKTMGTEVKLAPQHIAAAHQGLNSFRDCFHDKKSVVEAKSSGSDLDEPKARSDLTKEVLAATEALWKDQDKFQDFVAVKKEDAVETDDTDEFFSFSI